MNDKLELVHCGCGGEAKVDTKLISCAPVERKRVYCSKCYISTEWMKSEAEAITTWNIAMNHQITITWDGRIPPREIAKVNIHLHPCGISGECLNCGGDVYNDDPYCSHCGARLEWDE